MYIAIEARTLTLTPGRIVTVFPLLLATPTQVHTAHNTQAHSTQTHISRGWAIIEGVAEDARHVAQQTQIPAQSER